MPNRIGGMIKWTFVQNKPINAQQEVIKKTDRPTAIRPARETQRPVVQWPGEGGGDTQVSVTIYHVDKQYHVYRVLCTVYKFSLL